MSTRKQICCLAAMLLAGAIGAGQARAADACYYGNWSYYPQQTYYYSHCYYQPPASTTYQYHYSIYYPSRPRYVYYYNPVRKTYWGRYDLEAQAYSLLEEKDRKASLKEIPESAFPKPAAMPQIPGGKEGLVLVVPPAVPKDIPKDAPELPETK